ncbi:RNA polymerase sigma factor [Sphingopyxis indica]|nr:RNA polymerase sigma factor [Sphingopyxis indica]
MRRHRDSVYRLVRGQIGDADAALDVTQACFISAFAALDRYDGSRPFRLWIARIAINKCHDWARRRAVRRMLSFALPIDAAAEVAADQVSPETQLADAQELRRTLDAVAALPARLKEALMLRTIEGLSQAETAEVLGVSQKAVETRLHRARAKLAELLRD